MCRTYAVHPSNIKQMTRISYVDSGVDRIDKTWKRWYHSDEHCEDGTPILWEHQIGNGHVKRFRTDKTPSISVSAVWIVHCWHIHLASMD